MTSRCAAASPSMPNDQHTVSRKAALLCLFRTAMPLAVCCVWTARTLNHQRTSSVLFRRLSVRLPSHSCLDRTTTRYFWPPSCPQPSARNAIRSQDLLWLCCRIGSRPGFRPSKTYGQEALFSGVSLPAAETSRMTAGLRGCCHPGILRTVVLRHSAPFPFQTGLHGPSRLDEPKVA